MPSIDELEALRVRALTGDGTALEALCKALEPNVFRLCLRMLGHTGDAEDAAQDVLIKVVTHLSQFDGRSALTTWVHTIAVRHVLHRKKSRAETKALDEASFSALLDMGLAVGAGSEASDPEDRAFVKEVRLSCTQGMLMMLSREERLALVLVDLLGFDSVEASVVAEVSHDALRQRLSRARARLGGFLQEKCGLANAGAACRCERQVRAKKMTGKGAHFLPLLTDERPPAHEQVHAAHEELQKLQAIAAAFHADGLLASPATLHARLAALLPSVL